MSLNIKVKNEVDEGIGDLLLLNSKGLSLGVSKKGTSTYLNSNAFPSVYEIYELAENFTKGDIAFFENGKAYKTRKGNIIGFATTNGKTGNAMHFLLQGVTEVVSENVVIGSDVFFNESNLKLTSTPQIEQVLGAKFIDNNVVKIGDI